MVRRAVKYSLVLAVVGFIAIQLVPYGRAHANPAVVAEPAWDTPLTRELTAQACFACHSNETKWPWYSNVAPVSWVVQNHVDEGREALNFSEWTTTNAETGEITETVIEGEMPPSYYYFAPGSLKLTTHEHDQLIAGLISTFGNGGNGKGNEGGQSDNDKDD